MATTLTFRHLDSPDDRTRAFHIMKELRPHLRYGLGSIGLKSTHVVLLDGLARGNEAVTDALHRAREEFARHALFASDNAVTL